MDVLNSFLNTTQSVNAVIRRLAHLLRPPERIGTTEWARKLRRMSAKATASPGRYNPNITPWVFGMHAALDDPAVQKVVCMKSAQVAWTDGVLLNYIGRRIDVAPCCMGRLTACGRTRRYKSFHRERYDKIGGCCMSILVKWDGSARHTSAIFQFSSADLISLQR
ncbi:phage terminase large subunit family protein [Burkholderia thailandensis MSMB121]|nr:phage terminase large subunit family protein [Burkholderia thailandensis MSMB121]ATF34501.1 terminase [Burkholderia thailandensis]KST75073.1 terminase [Burkholderia humptydooensis]